MDRAALTKHILEAYDTEAEYPWAKYPSYAVFRHKHNRKWFAAILEIPKSKLGLPEDGMVEIVNLKCDPIMAGSLRLEPGFFPAYHMNKANWITAVLDSKTQDEKIKLLLDISYDLTAQFKKAKQHP